MVYSKLLFVILFVKIALNKTIQTIERILAKLVLLSCISGEYTTEKNQIYNEAILKLHCLFHVLMKALCHAVQ